MLYQIAFLRLTCRLRGRLLAVLYIYGYYTTYTTASPLPCRLDII